MRSSASAFTSWPCRNREQLVQAVQDAAKWHGFDAGHLWSLWTRYACTAFYSHPWAWNEMGFGGPAYPRGYKNMGIDRREDWERPEDDAKDPVPWAQRRESAKRAHEAQFPERQDRRGFRGRSARVSRAARRRYTGPQRVGLVVADRR